jgi:tRNA (mo5U34)-methyltransferase
MTLSKPEKNAIQKRLEKEGPVKWYHSVEAVPGSGLYTPGQLKPVNYKKRLKELGVDPGWLKGKRVIDIGAYTGAFAFFLEECGADVLATDVQHPEATGFQLLHELRDSKVEFRLGSVYDLHPDDFGYFDLVSFFGVFYHLKHPILALERINSVCKEGSILCCGGTTCDAWMHDDDKECANGASFINISSRDIKNSKKMTIDSLKDLPICGFAASHFWRDKTNWFIPSSRCLEGWLKRTGFQIRKSSVSKSVMPREWNTLKLERSTISCSAEYSGHPELEYSDDSYMKRYNPDETRRSLYQFEIPLKSEVDRLRARVEELENQLADKENQ